MVSAIIVAGGKGTRMSAGFNKVFLQLGNTEIITRTISVFEDFDGVDEIIIVTAKEDLDRMRELVQKNGFTKISHITEGGQTRRDSVFNGLLKASGDISLIHDGARCFVTCEEINAVITDTAEYGAAAVGVTVKDTLKEIDKNSNIVCTVDREKTVYIRTPQAFRTDEILALHKRAKADALNVTDDCSIFEHYGKVVHFTNGSYDNIKITTPEDIALGEEILKRRSLI